MKLNKNNDFLIFSIFTFLAIATWTGMGVYLAFTKPAVPKVTEKQLLDLDPVLDLETLNQLDNRRTYSPGQ